MKKILLVICMMFMFAFILGGCGDPDFSGERNILADTVSQEEIGNVLGKTITYYDDSSFSQTGLQVINVDVDGYGRLNITLESNEDVELFKAIKENLGSHAVATPDVKADDSFFDKERNQLFISNKGYELRIVFNSKNMSYDEHYLETQKVAAEILEDMK